MQANSTPAPPTPSSGPTPAARSARCTTRSAAWSASPIAIAEAPTGENDRPGRAGRRRRSLDRLPRPARDLPRSPLLARPARPGARLGLPRQDGDRRRHRALAAGRPPDLDQRRRADVRPRNPGQRHLDRRARLPARLLGPRRRPAADPPARRGPGGGDAAAEAADGAARGAGARPSLYAAATQLAFDAGTVLPVVYPLLALVISALGALGGQLRADRLRAPARPRHLRPLRPRGGRRRGARARRRRPALRRRAARVHRPLQRPARLHHLLRGAARRTR